MPLLYLSPLKIFKYFQQSMYHIFHSLSADNVSIRKFCFIYILVSKVDIRIGSDNSLVSVLQLLHYIPKEIGSN